MASGFQVHSATAYDQLMGRWSRKLAPLFIEFAGIAPDERLLDAGCGTGSLTFELANIPFLARVDAVDISQIFVESVQHRNLDHRVHVTLADVTELPFATATFDRVFSSLLLHFLPDPSKALHEMCRVTRSGGVVAALVWDHAGGLPAMRMMIDTLAAITPDGAAFRHGYCAAPVMHQGALAEFFDAEGLQDIRDSEIVIRMEFADFDDYWAPIAAGEGPLGHYVEGLDAAAKAAVTAAMRAAYQAGRADGPRSFIAAAWCCLGVVP